MLVSFLAALAMVGIGQSQPVVTSVSTPVPAAITRLDQLPPRLQITTARLTGFGSYQGVSSIDCPPKVEMMNGKAYYYSYSCTYLGKLYEAVGIPVQNAIDDTPPVNMNGLKQATTGHIDANGNLVLE